ncbi:apolipoprotein F [Octodon degus]|uniref:Apolipoprotein F n=1 Tax=Octodon degus TaxID=10160 RepID=A0A6P3V8J4_OCTDE|nr:apolipoprotein F [Octodon degus]
MQNVVMQMTEDPWAAETTRSTEQLHFSVTKLCGYSAPGMCSLRLLIAVGFLLCYLLLHPVDAISYRKQTNVSTPLVSALGSQPSSSYPFSCLTLLPKSLPGFTYMTPLPKYLVGLALRNALEEAGCQAEVQALDFQLYRWGGLNATQVLIRHLQGLQKGGSAENRVSIEALASALQRLNGDYSKRIRRSPTTKDCENTQEEGIYNVIQMVPGVGTYYNLGTALYYAIQNCSDKAKERGKNGAIDLGYDLLTAMAGMSGGPMGLVISASLKPALKAGVEHLIQYYYKEKAASTPQTETSKASLWTTSYISDLEETVTTALPISQEVSPAPYLGWAFFKSYGHVLMF